MKTVIDTLLRREAKQFILRFTCDDCAHFDRGRTACVHGYPLEEGRRDVDLRGQVIFFCKEFELGDPRPPAESQEGGEHESSR